MILAAIWVNGDIIYVTFSTYYFQLNIHMIVAAIWVNGDIIYVTFSTYYFQLTNFSSYTLKYVFISKEHIL